MAAQTDLWGEIIPAAVRTPLAILREQAALLGTKTKNLIEAKVETGVSRGEFSHRFKLVVPAMDNYTYELFTVTHGVDLYPVFTRVKKLDLQMNNEEDFVRWLKETLSSPDTKTLIGNLLAQATS